MVTSMLFEKIRSALRLVVLDEDGAVTVDWVVLSAAIIGVGMVVLTPIAYQTDSASEQVADYIAGGFDGHVAKPIDAARLYQAIAEAVLAGAPDRQAVA